jgi:arylsulfatase A-like enzyme
MAVVSHVFVSREYGFGQGFHEIDESSILGHDGVSSPLVTRAALEQLEQLGSEPFLLWVHYFDPHYTYVRHREFALASEYHGTLPEQIRFDSLQEREESSAFTQDDVRYIEAVYDEEIAYTDAWIGRLVDAIQGLALRRPTVNILTADHGEYFLERGRFGHGKDVYRELVEVPLIISGHIDERLRGRVVERSVEVASIAPTVLELAGIATDAFQGEDLLVVADRDSKPRPCFSEGNYAFGEDDRKLAVVFDGWKLVRHRDDGALELFHLQTDPKETRNLASSSEDGLPSVRERLERALEQFERRVLASASGPQGDARAVAIDPERTEHLRALGYVE